MHRFRIIKKVAIKNLITLLKQIYIYQVEYIRLKFNQSFPIVKV